MVSHHIPIVLALFLIFAGAAVLSTIALFVRQSLLVAYMLLGVILGPWVLNWVGDTGVLNNFSEIGIIFLLFLLGLQLPAEKLMHTLKKVSRVCLFSSLLFLGLGFLVSRFVGYTIHESLIVGAAMMFSSTIIGIKLLPTSVLHHQRMGELMIGILLLQDLLAIAVLIVIQGATAHGFAWDDLEIILVGLPAILVFAFSFERYVLIRLFQRFSKIREYLFLLVIAWCLGMAELAKQVGISLEVGAFIAGVSLAGSPIAFYVAESLKPIRDFFLVLFFFSVGARFDLQYLPVILMPALFLALFLVLLKPAVYCYLFTKAGETRKAAWEMGFRLGQVSEFAIIIAGVSLSTGVVGNAVAYLIEAATIVSFIVSSYVVVSQYPTPVALSDRLRKD